MPAFVASLNEPLRVTIPEELADETAVLTYLGVSVSKLKKIWHYRGRMYQHFSISKGPDKVRLISAPDQRLKMLQRKIADKLTRIIHRTARNRPRPPNSWARDFIAKNFAKQPIRIVVNDINGLALIAHFS